MAGKQGESRISQPEDSSGKYAELAFLIKQSLARLNVAMPVRVEAVNTDLMQVTVKPLIQRMDGRGEAIEVGVIYGIPYFRMHAGVACIKIDPVVGDIGFCVFCDRDIQRLKGMGAEERAECLPGSWASHSLSDGIYLGGILSQLEILTWIEFVETGININTLAEGGMININATAQINMFAPDGIYGNGNKLA